MKVKDLIELLQYCPQDDLIMAEIDGDDDHWADVDDVLVGGGTTKGFSYLAVVTDQEECDFCSCNPEWEDNENNFFMEMRTDSPWHGIHICLGFETQHENNIELDFNYCPMCGRKLVEGIVDVDAWEEGDHYGKDN